MKGYLEKSEVDVTGNPQKLALIGWGPKALPQPVESPGQPNNLRAVLQQKNTLKFQWDRSLSGGRVRNFIIERRHLLADNSYSLWMVVGTALNTTVNLKNQPRAVRLEYHVKAVNSSGMGMPGNTAAVVL